jgi:hypothetical protein
MAPGVESQGKIKAYDDAIRAIKLAEINKTVRRLIATKTHRTKTGEPIEFDDHYYMYPIYQSGAPMLVMQSSVMTGKSEYLIAFGIACCKNKLSVFHVLPKYDMRNAFVSERIDPLLQDTPEYAVLLRSSEYSKAADNKSIKLFGEGTWRFVSSNVRADFKSFDADVLIADEVDEFDMNNFAMSLDRLESSIYKITRYAGNPTVPGHGINTLYEGGSQYEMHYKCTVCRQWQMLDFFGCVAEMVGGGSVIDYRLRDGIEDHKEFVCAKCGAPLNRSEWKWLPTNLRGAPYPSYHLSALMSRRANPLQLWEEFCKARTNDIDLQVFYNSKLGTPYEQAGSAVTEDLLREAAMLKVQPEKIEKGWCTMGVDVGTFFDVRISKPVKGTRCCMHIGRYRSLEELLELVKRYRVMCAVIDILPETRKAKEFQDKALPLGCDVWLCSFKKTGEGESTKIFRDEEERQFKVDRTYAMDLALADLREGRNVLPINATSLLDGFYVRSMLSNKRVLKTDGRGNKVYKWTKEANDHQRFADVYDMLAGMVIGAPAADVAPTKAEQDLEGVIVKERRTKSRDRDFLSAEKPDKRTGDVDKEMGALKRLF